jgi:hypothetical protein
MRNHTRTYKLALLSKIVAGSLSDNERNNILKSREPLHVTLNLGDGVSLKETNDPTYHIDVYSDGTTKCYDRYADGRIVYRKS